MSNHDDAHQIFEVYESFLKSLRPRIPREISLLLLLVVTVMGAATLYHRVLKHPLFPNELDLIRIVLMLGYLGLAILPVIVSLFRPSPNRLTQYKAQALQDEEVIRALRAASSRERRRFQKFFAEALRLEEKYAELSAFVLALIGSLLLAFAHGLGSVKLPYSWLLIVVSLLAVSVQFFKWQVARKGRFVAYLEAAEEEETVSTAEELAV